jgi:hypothetical protein
LHKSADVGDSGHGKKMSPISGVYARAVGPPAPCGLSPHNEAINLIKRCSNRESCLLRTAIFPNWRFDNRPPPANPSAGKSRRFEMLAKQNFLVNDGKFCGVFLNLPLFLRPLSCGR